MKTNACAYLAGAEALAAIPKLLKSLGGAAAPPYHEALDDLDNIVKGGYECVVAKVEALNRSEQEFVETVRESLKRGSSKMNWVRLVQLTGVAIQSLNTGKRREDRLIGALARGLSVREKMAAEEGGNISADEAAQLLGMTKQSVLNLCHAGKALAWRTEKQGAFRFPIWQFVEGKRLPGLEEILAKLNEGDVLDDWGKIGFFLQSHRALGNRRPLDFLRENKVEPVLKAAEAYVQ